MSKSSPKHYYAVNKGHNVGVFSTWDECAANIKNYPGAKFKKFANKGDAEQFAAGGKVGSPFIAPPSISGPPSNGVDGVDASTHTVASTSTTPLPPLSTFGGQTTAILPSQTTAYKTPQVASSSSRGRFPIVPSEAQTESSCRIVYSDGACKGNGKPGSVAGIGVWWGPDDPRNISERCPGAQTNNRAELIAIARVLETAPFDNTPMIIRTDSRYSIDCFHKWTHKWVVNGWRNAANEIIKNKEVVHYISTLIDYRFESGHTVHLQYVKGHSGDQGNDGADALADEGCGKPEEAERDWVSARENIEKKIKSIHLQKQIKEYVVDEKELQLMADEILDDEEFRAEYLAELH